MEKQIEIPELTKMSTKGQVVIPTDIRKRLKISEGSVLAITARGDIIVLKKLETKMKPEDLRTLKLVEEAWEDLEKGRYKTYSRKGFFEELKKW